MNNPSKVARLSILLLLLIFTFSAQNVAQQKTGKRKVRYISSKSRAEITRPRVRVVRKGTIGRVASKTARLLKPTDFRLEKKVFKFVNEKRMERGLKRLVWSDKLANLARSHSQNMAKHTFFSHIGLNGRLIDQRATDFGVNKWRVIGENIAYNKGFENPAEFAVERWMLSQSHRNNLLDGRWKRSGVGIGITEDGMYFFTQVFLVK